MPILHMDLVLSLNISEGDYMRFGGPRCLVCGRKTDRRWGRRLLEWWHHRKCKPWQVQKVEHQWLDRRSATTRLTLKGDPPKMSWWDKLLGRTKYADVTILAYTLEK